MANPRLIKHFLPRAKIVPLILHHDVSWEEVEQLLAILEPWLVAGKSVLVASVDSPASLALLFRYVEKRGLSDFQILGNANLVEILGADLAETTSYFPLLFSHSLPSP